MPGYTLQDIITETRFICQETDPNNTHRTDALITADANACTLQLCSNIATLPKEEMAGKVAADTITFDTNLLKLDYASILDTNGAHTPLGTIDFPNFARTTSGWEDQPANRPSMLVRMTDLVWMMFPKPSAEYIGKALTLIGTKVPTEMANPSDVPAVSIVLHPCYPHYCAWKFFQVLNNPERASAEYAIFDSLRKINMQAATSTKGSLQAFSIRGM